MPTATDPRLASKRRTTPYYIEWMPQRLNDQIPFMEGLVMVGPQAIEDYINATVDMDGEAVPRNFSDRIPLGRPFHPLEHVLPYPLGVPPFEWSHLNTPEQDRKMQVVPNGKTRRPG